MPHPDQQRIGVLGGTFDPVHTAHIVAANEVLTTLRLERVLFVVAGDPWQKRGKVVASAADRLELVTLALDGIADLEASPVEIESGRASVTADTLELLAQPDRELFLVLGADAVTNMSTWRRLDETRDLATVVVVERAGEHAVVPPGPGWRVEHVRIPRLDISSTDIRERIAAGRAIDGLVPPAVVRSIRSRDLYTRP